MAVISERVKKQREQCITLAMENMGWSREVATKHVLDAHKNIGISYREYRRFHFFNIPDDQQKERFEEISQAKTFRKNRHSSEKEKYVENIMKYTGWPRAEVVKKMNAALYISGATFKDYYAFRFWEISEEEQKEYFTQKRSNLLSKIYDINEISRDILLNKELSCYKFEKFLRRQWCINKAVDLQEFCEKFRDINKIVYKPLDGNGGHGVEVFKLDNNLEEVFEQLKSYPRGVVEEYVIQHPDMRSLATESVNTIRVVTFAYNDGTQKVERGEYPVNVAYAAVRIGSGTSVVDNFTDGGFVVGVDMATGTVDTDGVTIEGIPYEKHPVTNTVFRGFKIPYFKEAIEMVKEAAKSIGGYTGWDVAISVNGPVLIEANIMPGNRILQMPYVKDRRGMMKIMKKYYGEGVKAFSAYEKEKEPVIDDIKEMQIPAEKMEKADDQSDFHEVHLANNYLLKYEIKHPDYDPVSRGYDSAEECEYEPKRFYRHNGQWVNYSTEKKNTAKLFALGDITCFEKQFAEAQKDGGFDFSYSLDIVKDVFKQADCVIGNLETMICPSAPYRTEKYVSEQNFHCNAPIQFLDALRKAGIDVLTNANNHDLDTGVVGIGETIDNVRKYGFIQTGTFKTAKNRFELLQVNGIKIAIVAFATNHNNKQCNLTEEGQNFILNNYSIENARKLYEEANQNGADCVITFIHWGDENKTNPNKTQRRIANELVEIGYDCIVGSHPHVLQCYEEINSVPVFYSLGNFISHNSNNAKGRSAIASIDIVKEGDECKITCRYIPIFTGAMFEGRKYVVLPIKADTQDEKNIRTFEYITSIIGNGIDIDTDVDLKEYVEDRIPTEEKKEVVKKPLPKDGTKKYYDSSKFLYVVGKSEYTIAGLSDYFDNSSISINADIKKVPITGIEEGAFQGNNQIKKINFGRNIKEISRKAFKGCTALEGFQLGLATKAIREEAFADCSELSAAVMKANVVEIESKAFANCASLRTVKLPKTVTKIADDAFENCDKAVFYCESGSYAEQFARNKGYKVVNMVL